MRTKQKLRQLVTASAISTAALSTAHGQNFFLEDFESYSNGNWQNHLGASGWSIEANAGGSNPFTWQVDTGGTSSSSTGPTVDNTTGTNTGKYLYAETSASGYPNISFITTSPTIDLTTAQGATLQLYIHRYGSTIGSLSINVSGNNGASYTLAQSFTGQRAVDPTLWEKVDIDLSAFDGNNQFKFQLDYTSGTSFTGDIAFDDILVSILAPPIDLISLNNAFEVHTITPRLAMTTINGAHHRLLMDSALDENGWHTWATGDFARFDEVDSNQTIGEVGASRSFLNDKLRFGMGVGYTSVDQDAIFGGGSDIDGEFVLAEANYRLSDSIILSSLLYYGNYDVETQRGYLLGGAKSRGKTDAQSLAVRLRADWKNAYQKNNLSITPRIAYTYIDTTSDSYTEVGGASPASFAKQDTQDHEVRLGFDFDYACTEKTQFRAILEAVHRSNDNNNLRGTSGGIAFNLPSEDTSETWGRLGFEVLHQINESTNVHASVFGSTEGYDATVSGSIGINMQF